MLLCIKYVALGSTHVSYSGIKKLRPIGVLTVLKHLQQLFGKKGVPSRLGLHKNPSFCDSRVRKSHIQATTAWRNSLNCCYLLYSLKSTNM